MALGKKNRSKIQENEYFWSDFAPNTPDLLLIYFLTYFDYLVWHVRNFITTVRVSKAGNPLTIYRESLGPSGPETLTRSEKSPEASGPGTPTRVCRDGPTRNFHEKCRKNTPRPEILDSQSLPQNTPQKHRKAHLGYFSVFWGYFLGVPEFRARGDFSGGGGNFA